MKNTKYIKNNFSSWKWTMENIFEISKKEINRILSK